MQLVGFEDFRFMYGLLFIRSWSYTAGKVLLMLGKTQFELQKLVDKYVSAHKLLLYLLLLYFGIPYDSIY